MGEQPIFTTKAHVFQIDPNTKKKWLPASSQAVSVSYYYDSTRNTYRIISVDGSKAVINSTITPGMTFTKTSVKFGQWSDTRANTVYGLGFNTEAELSKFVEKFKEVKELTRQAAQHQGAPQTNGTSTTVTPPISETVRTAPDLTHGGSPLNSPRPPPVTIPPSNDTSHEQRNSSTTNSPSLPANNQVIEQLKYENDRLKIALAQSSANAKKWEVELQTLKNNNARLTTALQESTSNVEEWKKQLAAYKEEGAKMKKRALEVEKAGGSELLQRQLNDARDKMQEQEKMLQLKQQEIDHLTQRLGEVKVLETQKDQLNSTIQSLEKENDGARRQVAEVKEQMDGARVAQIRDKQQLRSLQEQISGKVNELYTLNDKLAEMSANPHS